MSAENFLDKAKFILEQQKDKKSESSELNIFTILDKETDEESTHCRFLYEMLSPNGSHNQGDAFLKLFFQTVIDKEYPTGYIIVRREICLTDESRLDLMIDTDDCCYLIEAKINAGEQPKQVKRYCEWAEKRGKEYKMFFLTLDGHEANTADKYECTCISFKDHIIKWLEACKKIPKISNISTLIGAIEQYLQLLNKLTSKEKQNMSNLKELIKNNIESAEEVSKLLPIVKGEMVCKILQDIEKYISNTYGLESIENVEDYYKNKYQNYYIPNQNGKNPRISFKLPATNDSDYEYFLSIVVEDSLFIGCDILRFDNQSKLYIPQKLKKDRANYNEKYLLENCIYTSSLWYWWDYLRYSGENINFRDQNKNFYKLFIEKEYSEILKEIQDRIKEKIEQLKNNN